MNLKEILFLLILSHWLLIMENLLHIFINKKVS